MGMSCFPIIAQQGEIATCPECHTAVAELTIDIHKYDRLDSHQFRPLNGAVISYQTMPTCPKCHSFWIFDGKLHLARGWA